MFIKQGEIMYALLADRLDKAERRHNRPAIIARHMRTAIEVMVGIALVIGGNVVAWYWLLTNLGVMGK